MEVVLFILFAVIPAIVLVFVLPIAAMVKASRAKRKVSDLENRVTALDIKLSDISQRLAAADKAPLPDAVRDRAVTADEKIGDAILKPTPQDLEAPHVAVQEGGPSADTDTDAEAPAEDIGSVDKSVETPIDKPVEAPAEVPTSPGKSEERPAAAPASFEERIGVVWFTRIGALVGMVVTGWFFKYMVDNNWIGPWGRTAMGATVGIALLGIGEMLYRKKRTHPMFNQGMLGLGLSILLITAYASFAFYHLVPVITAFALIAVLCLLGGALAHYHKSELILVFSLIAAFLNPIMLSTGVDRPVALFTYLLVMTSAGHALSVIHGFKVATFTAVGGVLVLFIGWYARYFDIHPLPPLGMYDDPAYNRPGEYFSMAKRWIPLLFSILFVIEWIAAAVMHLKKARRVTGTVLLLIAAMASHCAAAAVLYDSPLLLGGMLIAFGALFARLLIRFELTQWLFLTMTSSFVILACLKDHIDSGNLLPILAMSGVLSALYFTVFLRDAIEKERRPSRLTRLLLAGSGLGLFWLGLLFLLPDHYHALAGFVTVLAGVFLLTAVVIASSVMSIGASIVGFIGLLISDSKCADVDFKFVAIAGLWFAVHTAIISYDALKRRREWTFVHMFVLSFAGIGFAALFLSATPPEAGIVRALLSLGEGAVYLMVGTLSLRSSSSRKNVALLPLGMAALAFTSALAFLLAGPSLTVAWAAEAAVLAYLASRMEETEGKGSSAFILGSIVVFITAVLHMLAADCPWITLQRNMYLDTAGASGVLMPHAFAHPQAWSLIALGTAFLLSVFFLRNPSIRKSARISRVGFLISGHVFYLWLLIHEFRLLFTTRPDIPAGLPKDEMMSMWSTYQSSLIDLSMRLQTVTTVVMGIYALLLIVLGFIIRETWHRRLGMILFAVTLVKLCLFDIWKFETLFRIIVGGATAFLLLIGGFLYARFGSRLKSIVSENKDKIAGLIVFIAGSSIAAPSDAVETAKYLWTRTVGDVSGPGDYVVEIDPTLYQASIGTPLLADIRIVGPEGSEVPYVVFSSETEESRIRDVEGILDPQALEDGASRAVIDLGKSPPTHHRVILDISGNDFLRAAVVESSDDATSWGILAQGELVYNIASANTYAVKTNIEYPESAARYLRITLKKGEDKSLLRILGAKFEIASRRPRKDTLRTVPLAVESDTPGKDKKSVISLAAMPKKIPFESLRIETSDSEFVRQIEMESSTYKNAWFSEGAWTVYRILRGQAPTAAVLEELKIAAARFSRPYIRLVVDNGDNPPLKINKVFAEYTAENIVLRATKAGSYTLYVGNKDEKPPRYDLASLIAEGSFTRYKPARLGPLVKNPLFKKAVPEQKPVPWTEKHAIVIQIGIVIAALLLLLWTIRLLRKSGKKSL